MDGWYKVREGSKVRVFYFYQNNSDGGSVVHFQRQGAILEPVVVLTREELQAVIQTSINQFIEMSERGKRNGR